MISEFDRQTLPKTGFAGLIENWRSDLIASFSVAMVALPLALGIAQASGVPPISGILSAIIGGVVTTFFRSSYVAINGPAAGLITVIFAAMLGLDDGTGNAFNYVLAAIVVSGAIQIGMGLLKWGKFGEIFPSSVIHGLLAAIGVIILGKQVHVALGSSSNADTPMAILLDIPNSLVELNPFVTTISVLGLLILVLYPKIQNRYFHYIPAAMWVLLLAVPLVAFFNYIDPHTLTFFKKSNLIGPDLLVSIPDNLVDILVFPNFSRIFDLPFWSAVISITLIATIAELAMTKAVDKLDPYKRKTDLNKDLIGVGISTMVAGLLGGLPIISVIVRSSVNVNNHARTKWSNFFHGLILILILLLFSGFIQEIPLAALAALLVYAGYKLASPNMFKNAYHQGWEQIVVLLTTLVTTLMTDLLMGILIGTVSVLVIQLLKSNLSPESFVHYLRRSSFRLVNPEEHKHIIKTRGIVNFVNILGFRKILEKLPPHEDVTIDFSNARLVDLTVLEYANEFGEDYRFAGGKMSVSGLESHMSTVSHPNALRVLPKESPQRVNSRQAKLKHLSINNEWSFFREIDWEASYLKRFRFFETRPIEYKENVISGQYDKVGVNWEISDITFDEGALLATEVFHTTVEVVRLPYKIPKFVLEKEGALDKLFDPVLRFAGYLDINFSEFPTFSQKVMLFGHDEQAIRGFFNKELIRFFENERVYHVESNGEALLIFRRLRLSTPEGINEMVHFCRRMVNSIEK